MLVPKCFLATLGAKNAALRTLMTVHADPIHSCISGSREADETEERWLLSGAADKANSLGSFKLIQLR